MAGPLKFIVSEKCYYIGCERLTNVSLVVATCAAAVADIPQDMCGNVLQLNGIYCPRSYRNAVVTK